MSKSRLHLLALAAVLAAHAQVKTAQEMGNGVGQLQSGVTLKYKTVLEPPVRNSAFRPLGGAFRVTGDSMVHCIYDRAAQSYFGYEMSVWPGDAGNTRRVTIGPANSAEVVRALKGVAGDLPLNPAPQPLYPAPQIVRNGDTLAMDLMVSPDGRERIVDYVEFSFGVKAEKPAADTAVPQDFTMDDGPLKWELGQAEARIDGRDFRGYVVVYAWRGGATPWFYFPGQGRYALSLGPHDGFEKAGVLRASVISFTADGHEYEIRLTEPPAGLEKAWNLYVSRDAAYLPRPALVNAVVGSVDRLENLVKK
jgi:hypothetical protein